jgi:endonuclease/exonuclease/phosphatase family metal-dependent hydrolase
MRVLFASYNIQYGFGEDGRQDLERIAREVEAADVIALQEVAAGFARNDHLDQAEWLARRLDRFMVYGAPWDTDASYRDGEGRVVNRRRRFGSAVLSRWPIRSTRMIPLPFRPPAQAMDIQRCAVEAVVEIPGHPLRVYSVHLSHLTTGTRLPQLEALLAAAAWPGRTATARTTSRAGPRASPSPPRRSRPSCWATSTCGRTRRSTG